MTERESNQGQIPLFDEIPKVLSGKKGAIMQTFDGTLGSRGVEITINPMTGDITRGRFFDLLSGKVETYEPLARGKWCSPTSDLRVGSFEYEKLERVSQDVKDKFMLWKVANPHHLPMREWTTVRGRRYETPGSPKITLPTEWFEKEPLISEDTPNVSLAEALNEPEEEMIDEKPMVEEKPKKRTIYKKLPIERTGRVTKSNTRNPDIIPSKEAPRLRDAKPAPSGYKRNADRDVKKALQDKDHVGKRTRRAMGR